MNLQAKDQLGRTVLLPDTPRRIVSLVPSQTELLHDLGLEEEVIGITRFCIHPTSWRRSKVNIGGTKKLHLDKIRQLAPDLIIGNKEENSKEDLEPLMEEFPVWMSDISNLEDALDMIESIGAITGKARESLTLVTGIKDAFASLEKKANSPSGTVLYFIWKDPWMAAGGDTFIGDMLRRCGLENVLDRNKRYPELEPAMLASLKPDTILLSSEPYPFKQHHINALHSMYSDSRVLLVDGEMFSWYGSRLLKAPSYFEKLIEQIHAGC